MRWFIPVMQFLWGFAQGYSKSQREQQVVGHNGFGEFGGGYDWGEHMQSLTVTGARLMKLKSTSAAFELQINEAIYVIILLHQGSTVQLSVCSAITFPCGQAPRDISAGLARVNRQMERCDYELINGDNGDFYCVQSRIGLDRLTPDSFYIAVNDMLPHVLALEKYLLEHGYAR
jgi:hypothetical protein